MFKQSLKFFLLYTLFLILISSIQAQFVPVTVTGFNQDGIAESGTSSLTNTSLAMDAFPASNKVMYTLGFRTSAGLGGGGLPNNGTITDAAGSYQLAPFDASNVLLVQRNQNADLTLSSPASFGTIRILAFTTEGTSLVNIKLYFSDGSITNAVTGYSLGDWFNGTTNLVLSGFGRCTRATPASGADGYSTNPRMYFIEIPLTCADRNKVLQKINFANLTTAGSNAPYPNSIFMAVSGKTTSPTNISAAITQATCSNNGAATLTITGTSTPYAVSWNTNPVQTGLTATNLTAGNYVATVTDANSCVSTLPVAITLTNNLTMNNKADTSICFGASFNANIISNASAYSWTPSAGVSNSTIANPVLSPTNTTTYTVTGTAGSCTINKSFIVNVAQAINVNAGPDASILSGSSTQLIGAGPVGTYAWTPATGLNASNILNPVASPVATTTYTLRITTAGGCTNTDNVLVTVIPYCIKPLNAFSPNGDGINDKWFVTNGNCTKNIKAMVFNRYGTKVYESNDYKNTWDGTYKGKALPDATYYYTLQFTLLNDAVISSKGDVTILR
ncbi:MAG: gliding motility-associated C-terminal domain-containing protein [Chitinophagaceae bacterium]